jgi:hypothetical protein
LHSWARRPHTVRPYLAQPVARRLKDALKKHDGFPIGVLLSLHDGGILHLWPRSFDAAEVRGQERVTVRLRAGDVLMFHGALVHEGAGYKGADGEYHLRLHFYTQSTHGKNAWPISNETEHIRLV